MDWHNTIQRMNELAGLTNKWKFGQDDTIRWMSNRLKEQTGILIADEVGMGKTRIAMAAILAVLESGGSVAVVVPPGLIYQWKKEWEEFLKSIGNKGTDTKNGNDKNNDPIMLRSYYSLFEDKSLQFPLAQNAGRWLLISHQFGPPIIRNNTNPRRYMLPVLVKALIDNKSGKGKRNRYWQFANRWLCKDDDDECIVNASVYLVKNGISLDCDDLPSCNLDSDKEAKEYFRDYFNDEKRKRGRTLIKKLLGSIDLLIIDEAHKNRDVEEDFKRLGIILWDIIETNADAKRIALTATPMELNADQWREIFTRIGEEGNYPKESVKRFVDTHREANKHPDNIEKIEDLIKASKEFADKLKPYVTRRMRTKQKEMRDLIGEDLCKKEAHPHREWKPIKIDYNKIEDEWKPSVFVLEAIGKAAKGCITGDKDLNKQLGRLKIADIRYAAGKISTSGADSTNKETDGNGKDESNDQQKLKEAINKYFENNELNKNEYNLQSYLQGKLRRIQYWNCVLKSNNADLGGHPRIRFTADEIEKNLWDKNGQLKQEKVLVFGTFLEPLKSLWDVLNRRTVLRLLNRKRFKDEPEPPIPGKDTCIKNLDGIWAEYQRKRKMIDTGVGDYKPREYSSKDELKLAIESGGERYDSYEEELEKHINNKFVETLPGDEKIKKIENAENKVAKLLRVRLINNIICSDTEFKQFEEYNTKIQALRIWCEYLKSFLDNENEPDHEPPPKPAWARPDYFTGYEKQADIEECVQLDRFACNVSKEALQGLLEDELKHLSGYSGMFARMLYRKFTSGYFTQHQ